jgi:hypothetical protein
MFFLARYGQEMTEGYRPVTSHENGAECAKLTPASRDELLMSIEYSLGYDSRGKASNASRELAISVLAGRVIEHLEMSNYVVMKKPPAKAWRTPGKPAIPMKD